MSTATAPQAGAPFTVVGASGFIGSALARRLRDAGCAVFTPERGSAALFERPLGALVYAAGVTADFRERPFDTLRAHTVLLADLLERARFDSLTYLSSARVYRHAEHTGEEAAIALRPGDPEDLYDLTKLTAEALCRAGGSAAVRVVRLSNVVGADFGSRNFVTELIRSACDTGAIRLRSALDSEKDYVALDDVLDLLPRIASGGAHACYNLGSGHNLTHREVAGAIATRSGATLQVEAGARSLTSRPLDTSRIRDEFQHRPRPVLALVADLVDAYRQRP